MSNYRFDKDGKPSLQGQMGMRYRFGTFHVDMGEGDAKAYAEGYERTFATPLDLKLGPLEKRNGRWVRRVKR